MTTPTQAEFEAAVEKAWEDHPAESLSIAFRLDELMSLLQNDVTNALWEFEESEPANVAYLRLSEMIQQRTKVFMRGISASFKEWADLYPNIPRSGETDPRWAPVASEAVTA